MLHRVMYEALRATAANLRPHFLNLLLNVTDNWFLRLKTIS